jgi:hypothetical protein
MPGKVAVLTDSGDCDLEQIPHSIVALAQKAFLPVSTHERLFRLARRRSQVAVKP